MHDIVPIGIKALAGGVFVVAFSLIGEMAAPKRFAGLFSAAPSIALSSLLVVVLVKGSAEAQRASTGMIVGAIAFVLACGVGVTLIRRFRALRGSLLMCGAWLLLAEAGYLVALR